jgi:hypothetical protein
MDTDAESNLKSWLPRIFPERVRFIVTCDKDCESHNHLSDIGCEVIQMETSPTLFSSMIENLYDRPTLATPEHAMRCYAVLESKHQRGIIDNTLYIKTFCGAFVPNSFMVEDFYLESDEVFRTRVNEILSEMDFERIENIHNTDDLMDYILEYFENRIMKKEKFQKVCSLLILTFKG